MVPRTITTCIIVLFCFSQVFALFSDYDRDNDIDGYDLVQFAVAFDQGSLSQDDLSAFAAVFGTAVNSESGGPILHYPLDSGSIYQNTVYDYSGNFNDGTNHGASQVSDCRIGDNALDFDGANSYVDAGTVDISGSALTIMAWFKADDFGVNDGRIISKATGIQEQDHYWMISTINSSYMKLRFRLSTNNVTSTLIAGNSPLQAGEWVHVAAVYDGQNMILYQNGEEAGRTAKIGSVDMNSTVPVWIGMNPGGDKPFDGIIDEIKIYQRALSTEEIQSAYQGIEGLPFADFDVDQTSGQAPLSVNFTDLSFGEPTAWEWDFNNDAIIDSIEQNPAHTYEETGTYSVSLRVTNAKGSDIKLINNFITVTGSGPGPTVWTHLSTVNGDLETPTASGNAQTASLILDINQDGINDFVIADRGTAPSLVWYERNETGWEKHIIEDERVYIEAGGTYADIDSDGDLDIVQGGDYASNEVWWWENPYPDYSSPWTRRLIKDSGSNGHHDQIFGDFDNDGQDELVFWNQHANGTLFYAEIPSDPHTAVLWDYQSIFTAGYSSHEGLAKADINQDGKTDIVGAGYWFEHTGGTEFTPHRISTFTFSRSGAGQLKQGGWAEVVIGPGDNSGDLSWFEWDGQNWVEHVLIENVDHGHSLQVIDMNSDGHLDIFCAEMRLNSGNSDAKTWVLYGDGNGNFTEEIIAEGLGNHESKAGDLDNDGDMDILGKPYNWDTPRLDIHLQNGTGPAAIPLDQWEAHLIDDAMPDNAVFIEAEDLNGDGHIDLVAGAWWWENPGVLNQAWTRRTIGQDFNNLAMVLDADDDGHFDLLGTMGSGSDSNHDFVWARNNGIGEFTIYTNIGTGGSGDFLQGVSMDVFQSIHRQVMLSWHNGGGGVQSITIPGDPINETWSFNLETSTTQREDLSHGDIDNDGDSDLLLGTVWLENTGSGWAEHSLGTVTSGEPDRNDLADIDGDGDLDVVIGLENGTDVIWFENPLPGGDVQSNWTRRIIGTSAGQGFSMDTGDIDNDGDNDVVIGEHRGSSENRVLIFENNGTSENWPVHVADSRPSGEIDHHDGTQLVDIDEDGDLDIISIGWYQKKVWIFENRGIR